MRPQRVWGNGLGVTCSRIWKEAGACERHDTFANARGVEHGAISALELNCTAWERAHERVNSMAHHIACEVLGQWHDGVPIECLRRIGLRRRGESLLDCCKNRPSLQHKERERCEAMGIKDSSVRQH